MSWALEIYIINLNYTISFGIILRTERIILFKLCHNTGVVIDFIQRNAPLGTNYTATIPREDRTGYLPPTIIRNKQANLELCDS
jgi:hypothetical protein